MELENTRVVVAPDVIHLRYRIVNTALHQKDNRRLT
jgi:hypothetical protein